MVFSSMTFLMLFLPILLIVYFAVPKRFRMARNIILLAISVFFYAWGEPLYVFLIVICISATYFASKKIAARNKWAIAIGVTINLIPLAVFKYIDFIIINLNLIPGVNLPVTELPLPIGISFYTFQVLTYMIDLYRGQVKLQKNPLNIALYVFLFPQLIAGPIVRYSTVEEQITGRNENWELFLEGFKRFVLGLAKKVLIANQAGYIVHTITAQQPDQIGTGLMWLAVFSFAIQIYFDFSGYSDMAIGLGRMVGFKFLENFNYPYVSKSITEFWRRWHISLSSFFRDYVYIPLGGNRVSKGRWLFNIIVVWMLTGFWHGPFWNYITWGLFYGILLIIEKNILKSVLERIPAVLSWAYAFVMTLFGWAIFMTETNNPMELVRVLGKMIGIHDVDMSLSIRALELQPYIPYLLIGFILAFPLTQKLKQIDAFKGRLAVTAVMDAVIILLYASSLVYIIAESFNPFIYFRF